MSEENNQESTDKYVVLTTSRFKKQAKAIRKKYPEFKNDLSDLINSLEKNPLQGESIKGNLRKIRITITGKPAGKSYGARVITGVYIEGKTIYLLMVYDKSDQDDLTTEERLTAEEVFKELKEEQDKPDS